MRTILLTLLLVGFGINLQAQIRQIEYGWDTDKGHELNTLVSVTEAGNDADVDLNIPMQGLTNGYHQLFIRTCDAEGLWSHTYLRLVNVLAGSVPAKVVKVDYTYSQAGKQVGQYTYQFPTPATSVQLTVPGDVSQLVAGQSYTIDIWSTDENGTRSQVYSRSFTYKFVDCKLLTATIAASTPGFTTGGSVTLTATTNTGQTYQWTLDGKAIAGATQKTYTARQPSSYAIIISNSAGCQTTSLSLTISLITALEEPEPGIDFQILVSPNPTKGIAEVLLKSQCGRTISVTLTMRDLTGRSLYEKQIKLSCTHTEQLDLSRHPAGLYILNATTGTQQATLRLIRE